MVKGEGGPGLDKVGELSAFSSSQNWECLRKTRKGWGKQAGGYPRQGTRP